MGNLIVNAEATYLNDAIPYKSYLDICNQCHKYELKNNITTCYDGPHCVNCHNKNCPRRNRIVITMHGVDTELAPPTCNHIHIGRLDSECLI